MVVRDEADLLDAQLAYHLNAGVDFVIVTEHGSQEGTAEILESYAREGYLLRLPEQGEAPEAQLGNRLAPGRVLVATRREPAGRACRHSAALLDRPGARANLRASPRGDVLLR